MNYRRLILATLLIVSWLAATAFQPLELVSPAASLPGSFGKTSPTDGGVTQSSTSATLQWSASNGATSYQYCLRTNKAFCPPGQWKNAGSDTQFALSNLTANTTYYWEVRAVNNSGSTLADNGAWWTFRTTPSAPAPFGKISPANGAPNQPLSLTLSWQPSTYAASYQYCYAAGSSSNCTQWTSTTSTSAVISGLLYGTTYSWQVRAVNNTGTTGADGGNAWSFSTISAPPGAFLKQAPANNALDQPTSLALQWTPSASATSYAYCLDTTAHAAYNATCNSTWQSAGLNTSVTVSSLAYATTYYWQVEATGDGGTTLADSGNWWTFSTLATQPSAFSKLSPSNGATSVPLTPTLYWNDPNPGGSYAYCVTTTAPGSSNACDTTWQPITANTPIEISTPLTRATTYYWQVRKDVSTYADNAWWSFTTVLAPPTSHNQSFSTPEQTLLSGKLVYDTSSYPSSTVFLLSGALPAGTLELNGDGTFAYLPPYNYRGDVTFQFVVSDGYNLPAGPYTATVSVTPVNHAPVLAPIPNLSVLPGSQVYYTAVATDQDSVYDDTLTYALAGTPPSGAVIDSLTGVFSWAVSATPGNYPFTVTVTDSGGGSGLPLSGALSASQSFTINVASVAPFAFDKVVPLSGPGIQPPNPILAWSDSANVSSYEYCLDTALHAANDTTCNPSTSASQGWQPVSLNTSVALSGLSLNTQYYWQVRATNAIGDAYADDGAWFNFTTIASLPSTFGKISPAQNAIDQPVTPFLYWYDPTNNGNYTYCITSNNVACPPTSWITISWNTPIQITTPLSPDTQYYWQVRQNTTGADNNTMWSFTTLKAPPTVSDQVFTTPENQALTDQLQPVNSNYAGITYTLAGLSPAGQSFTLNKDGSFTYTPTAYFVGQVSFQFQVSDGYNPPVGPYTATITVTLDPQTISLKNLPMTVTGVRGKLFLYQVLITDPDLVNGDTVLFSLGSNPPPGSMIDPASGLFIWLVPDNLKPGNYSAIIQVTNSTGKTDSKTLTIAVKGGILYLPLVLR